MMTETLNPPPSHAAESSLSENPQIFVALLWTFLALLSGNDTAIRAIPLRFLYLAALATPFALVSIVVLRRRVFSARMPLRWPAGSATQRRLGTITLSTMPLAVLCFGLSMVLRSFAGRHDLRYTTLHDAGYFLLSWGYAMTTYIADRRPLPAPIKSSPLWEEIAPIHSDHWGNRGPLGH